MSLTRVPDDEVANIVTSLQMLERPKPRPMAPSNLRLDRWREPAPERYRALFRRQGNHPRLLALQRDLLTNLNASHTSAVSAFC